MKIFLIINIINLILISGCSAEVKNNQVLTSSASDYYLVPDILMYKFSSLDARLEIKKDKLKDKMANLTFEFFGCVYDIEPDVLDKIISPEIYKAEVTKVLNDNKIKIVVPFLYYSISGAYPSDSEYSISDNLLQISITNEKIEISIQTEESGKRYRILESAPSRCRD